MFPHRGGRNRWGCSGRPYGGRSKTKTGQLHGSGLVRGSEGSLSCVLSSAFLLVLGKRGGKRVSSGVAFTRAPPPGAAGERLSQQLH